MSNIIYKRTISTPKHIQEFYSWLLFLLGFKPSTKPSINPFLKAWPIPFVNPFNIIATFVYDADVRVLDAFQLQNELPISRFFCKCIIPLTINQKDKTTKKKAGKL